ncbi:HAMP domain-containing sensor histidine kinase [Clostridium sp. MB40-C1]|uniref:sensor histidine kinase n=1 Tax=Clostridium sp. MB40-C1 TaxID=3070996 RepID=UPI0027E0C0A5|nr:HAMP domain-containing sensor histidine kinase [Clostridium sp. MB40-C1]WMJ79152.1 HAMP domain-containing sensor histidine kinase [Clostridium sp. MB40-C1]
MFHKPKFRLTKRLIRRFYAIYSLMREKTSKSVRMELLVTFFICFLLAAVAATTSWNFFRNMNVYTEISYDSGIRDIDSDAERFISRISDEKISIKEKEKIEEIIGTYRQANKILITDLDGKIIYKNKGASETQVDVYSIIKNAMEARESRGNSKERKEYTSFYPITFADSRAYLIYSGIPEGEIIYNHPDDFPMFMAFIVALAIFILAFLFFTRRKMAYIEEISNGLIEISSGNLDFKVAKKGDDQLACLADNINNMSFKLNKKIEEERRAEETKNQLITNVSHDLRTPLTSIMGYLGLIKEKRYENEEQLNEYVNIAFNKSEKLKVLIEDLFEYTKVANKVVNFDRKEVIINELLMQLIEEFVPVFEENDLKLDKDISKEKFTLKLDANKTVRAFENLLMNSVKYSFKPSVVNIRLYKENHKIMISIHNKGKNIPQEELEYLFERFYRVDKSRTGENGGSGLGLAIAKNIVESQNGKIWAECKGEDIYFFVGFNIEEE